MILPFSVQQWEPDPLDPDFLKDSSDMTHSEELAATIGTAIRRARKDAGLTQQQLAELAELSDRTVREIELGSGNPGLGSVLVVLTVLGLDLTVTS